jgi:AsmA protein
MNNTLKWILIIGAGVGSLLTIALVSLPFIIDPNDYKDKINSVVHNQTGRVLSIPGDITLNISPTLDIAFSLGEIQLAASGDFPGTHFASSKLAEIKLALWPLLSRKQLQINSVELSGVQLNLIRKANGQTNWEDLAGKKASGVSPKSQEIKEVVKDSSKKPLLSSIDIGAVIIQDINLDYQDLQANTTASLNNFNLNVGHLQENKPFPVSAGFTFKLDNNKQPLSASITTNFTVALNLTEQHFVISDFILKGDLQGEMFPSSRIELSLMGDVEIHARDEQVELRNFVVQQGKFSAKTALSVSGFNTPAIKGTFSIAEYSPKNHLEQLGIVLPQFSDSTVLEAFSASLGFALTSEQIELKEIQLQLDDTAINGQASVTNLTQPSYALDIHVGTVDIDRYAITKNTTAQKEEPSKEKSRSSQVKEDQIVLPITFLKGLTFRSNIKIDGLKAAKLRTSDILITADGKDGLIRLQPFAAKLYGGTVTATGKIDVSGETPVMNIHKSLNAVELGPLFVDMTGNEEITGTANIEVDVKTMGADKKSLTKNSNGTVTLALADGKIAKLQILQTIRLAKALLDKKALTQSAATQPTGFATLTASGKLTNGVFTNNDLLAESDLMKVTGKGKVDFTTEQIDYLLTVNLTDRIERDKETGLVDLGNTPIPYRIRGTFQELEQSAAMEELLKAQAKDVLMNVLQKQLNTDDEKDGKSTNDAGSLINKGLKGLFGN